MKGRHREAGVLSIEIDGKKALLAQQSFVDLEEPRLDHLERFILVLNGCLHVHGWIYALRKVNGRRRLVEQLNFQEKFCVQVARLHFNFSSKLYDISEDHKLLCIPDEEDLWKKAVGLIVDIGFDEAVEADLLLALVLVREVCIFALVVVWIRIVYFLWIFIENLEF